MINVCYKITGKQMSFDDCIRDPQVSKLLYKPYVMRYILANPGMTTENILQFLKVANSLDVWEDFKNITQLES